jgi:predicted transcriptional regulator
MTQEQIAKSEGVSQAAIAQRLMTAKIAFQKIFKNFS